ncbi:hypothetical protein L916_19239 [Phytophthora nicotianae]|uniref:Uncharacterized protein n=1 Tax=Phytophthora nicotianae TaxID=4792 RepID=W2HZ15_PHYNI|nr:hypothetical protein L916_19239 [Phytophthora nicotianae]
MRNYIDSIRVGAVAGVLVWSVWHAVPEFGQIHMTFMFPLDPDRLIP